MRPHVFTAMVFCFLALATHAGTYDMLFCTKVDSLGNCKDGGNSFKWATETFRLHLLVINKDGLNTKLLKYKVYEMKNDREVGDLAAELSSYVMPQWLYAQRTIVFFKPGYYKVEVYNIDNQFLNSAFVTITDR